MAGAQDNVIIRITGLISSLPNLPNNPDPKILKVNDQLRQVNEKAYKPEIVSIGPIHHGKPGLQDMENHKVRYLNGLIQRTPGVMETCVPELRALIQEARGYYSTDFQYPNDEDKFVQILLLDGILLIELLRKFRFVDRRVNDFVFGSNKVLGQVTNDLLLLENQLPLFVIQKLFDLTRSNHPEDRLQPLVINFLGCKMPWRNMNPPPIVLQIRDTEYHHILGLLHKTHYSFTDSNINESVYIRSASELQGSGIKFALAKNNTLKDIKFSKGVLELPSLMVSDETESIIRNLIAYEQSLPSNSNKYVTDYVVFIQCLISSPNSDADILRRAGILENRLGDNDMVYNMLHNLMNNVLASSNFCFKGLFGSVRVHCHSGHNKRMARLKNDYCNSIWGKLSIAAATALLILTTAQTTFAVLAYLQQVNAI